MKSLFSDRESRPIQSIACDSAEFAVMIDGKPYAGFINRTCAEAAIALWCGEIDGIGNPLPPSERGSRGWPAVRGRRLEIIERGEYRYRTS